MSVGGNRGRVIISKTKKGIKVEVYSLYSDGLNEIRYYDKYPEIPEDWDKTINSYMTTEADYFMHNLGGYIPFRIIKKIGGFTMKQYKITYDRQGEELLIAHENNNCTFKIFRYENEYKNKMIIGKKENNLEVIGKGLEAVGYTKIEKEKFNLDELISIANNLSK